MRSLRQRLRRVLRRPDDGGAARSAGRAARRSGPQPGQPGSSATPPQRPPSPPESSLSGRERAPYPGDFRGVPDLSYSPNPDGQPDPGEIVWTWVPYEEDHSQGKDRPVLVVGRDGAWLLGLMLTSQDHDRDARDEARHGRHWVDIGSGPWDRQGRPSEVRVDRVLRLDPGAVRREGAVLGRRQFEAVAAAVQAVH